MRTGRNNRLRCRGTMLPAVAALSIALSGTAIAQQSTFDFAKVVQQATAQRAAGARGRLFGQKVVRVRLPELLESALEGNLLIRQMAAARRGAQADSVAADAAFDLAINGSWSYTKTYGYSRGSYLTRERANSPSIVESETTAEPGCITIDGQVVNFSDPSCTTGLVYGTEYELASLYYDKPPFSWTGSLGADKYLPWGAQVLVSVSLTMSHSNSYAVPGLYSALSDSDPYGYGSRFPWTSSAAIGMTSPLPFTKYFGDGFAPNWQVAITEVAERQSAWLEKAVRIQVLQQVVNQFWSLVQTRHRIETLAERLSVLEAMAKRAQRRYDRQLVTAYSVAQVQASIETVRGLLESGWASYHSQSAALQVLLGRDAPAILVPVDYAAMLDAAVAIPDNDEAVAVAYDRNPDIHSSLESLAASDATTDYRAAQTRPDLRLEVSFSASQSGSTFGYDDPVRSLSNLVEPDQTDLYVGLRLNVPFNNRAEKAALSRARAEQRQAVDTARLTRNRVTALVEESLRELRSAREQAGYNRENLARTAAAFDDARRLFEHELVTQYDVLLRQNDLFDARLAIVTTAIRMRLAQAQLLAAQGILDERLEQVTGRRQSP